MTTISLASLVNRSEEHEACRRSLLGDGTDPRILAWEVVRPNERGWNAAQGLNAALERATGEWVILVHQDVRFPPQWVEGFLGQVAALPREVAIVGVAGATRVGAFRGHLVDPNGHCHWPPAAAEVLTVDECLIAVRSADALRFDEGVPGFHCYGAELCLRTIAEGRGVRTIDAPVLHLSTGRVDATFDAPSRYVLEKWGAAWGHYIPTSAAPIVDPARAGKLRHFRGRFLRWRSRRTRMRGCSSEACRHLLAAWRAAGA